MPALSSADRAIRAANELVQALRNPHPASPLAPIGTEQLQALEQLSEIFGAAVPRVDKDRLSNTAPKAALTNDSKTHSMQTRQAAKERANSATTTTATEQAIKQLQKILVAPQNMQTVPRVEVSNQATLQPPTAPQPPPTITEIRKDIQEVVNNPPMPTTPMEWPEFMHVANAVINPDTGLPMEYRELLQHPKTRDDWLISSANEFGRLAQGIRDIPGTDTIFFIR